MSDVKVNPDSAPVGTFGVHKENAIAIRKSLAPRYDVVHNCTDPDAAFTELPALFSGDQSVRPSNGIGSNSEGSNIRIPKIMICGGDVPPEQKQRLYALIKEKADGVKFVEVDREKMVAGIKSGRPVPEVVTELLLEELDKLK
ncbi:uncharacterized protein AB675_10085 [Cyphellophora attinorum]|uniref:Uncharacterized protein n=1 Tax=Cyphellophora attinorum TaxID=1664694 RepID=A0A0N1GZJ6_9EURO|nr:uncharacterized protein AB675_10085 [Phialophora attinorum]KPI36635.1 hypothetical protein AB675_10085 [Phialophora attinorum]